MGSLPRELLRSDDVDSRRNGQEPSNRHLKSAASGFK